MSSTRSSEDEISSRTGEVLETANKHFKEGFDILNHEINIIRMELEACDKSSKKLEHVHFSKTLKLNIGGHLFSTSLETLSKDSGSMLHAMFSGRFETKPSEDGSYFIDRDGTHFRYILNYLRTGQLIVPEDKIVRKELLAEAEFYQIGGIISELTARPFKDSLIVPSILDQRETFVNWLKDFHTNLHPVLLYRGSRDGLTGANLHSCCDNNKGPTLTVVQVYTRVNSSRQFSVCGGYTEEQWEGASAVSIKAADSFLFRFDFEKPVFSNAGSYPHSACCCLCRYGPVFSYGGDVVCVNAPNDSGNYTVTLNDESQNLSEMEVFGFNKK